MDDTFEEYGERNSFDPQTDEANITDSEENKSVGL